MFMWGSASGNTSAVRQHLGIKTGRLSTGGEARNPASQFQVHCRIFAGFLSVNAVNGFSNAVSHVPSRI